MGMLVSAARVRKRAREGRGCSAMGDQYYHECKMQNAKCKMEKYLRLAVLFTSAFCILHSAVASEFKLALPGYEFQFPRDHGSHPSYRTEWWYYTGHLRTASGKRYGFEVTFFRVAMSPPSSTAEPRVTSWD